MKNIKVLLIIVFFSILFFQSITYLQEDEKIYLNLPLVTLYQYKYGEQIPREIESILNTSRECVEQGKFEEAIINYEKVIQIAPDYTEIPNIYNTLGVLYEKIGFPKKSIEEFLKAIESANTVNIKITAIRNLAMIYKALEEYDKAIQLLESGKELKFDKYDYYNYLGIIEDLGRVYYTLGQSQIAIKYLQEVLSGYKKMFDENQWDENAYRGGASKMYHWLSKAYYDIGDIDKAKELAKKSKELWPPKEMLDRMGIPPSDDFEKSYDILTDEKEFPHMSIFGPIIASNLRNELWLFYSQVEYIQRKSYAMRYDGNKWHPPISFEKHIFSVCSNNKKIVACSKDSYFIYEDKKWSDKYHWQYAAFPKVCSINNKIYIFFLDRDNIYYSHLEQNKWTNPEVFNKKDYIRLSFIPIYAFNKLWFFWQSGETIWYKVCEFESKKCDKSKIIDEGVEPFGITFDNSKLWLFYEGVNYYTGLGDGKIYYKYFDNKNWSKKEVIDDMDIYRARYFTPHFYKNKLYLYFSYAGYHRIYRKEFSNGKWSEREDVTPDPPKMFFQEISTISYKIIPIIILLMGLMIASGVAIILTPKPNKFFKIIFGTTTLWPIIYIVIFFSLAFLQVFTTFTHPEPRFPYYFTILFILHFVTMLWIGGLLLICILHLFRTNRVAKDKKALWAVVLFLGNMLAIPVYFYIYIWRESKIELN